jgi:hypothetical protein
VGTGDEPFILPETARLQAFGVLNRPVGRERLDHVARELHGAALAVLWRGECRTALGRGLGAPDAQDGAFEIHVLPAQPEELWC